MKKICKKVFLIYMILIIFSTSTSFAATTDSSSYQKTKGYDYSIHLGTKEWKNLNNHDDKIKACYISEDKLKTMSTDELVILVLNYPLLIDVFAYDTFQDGIEIVSTYCSPMEELLNRSDAGQSLLKTYKEQSVSQVFSNENDNYGNGNIGNNNFLKQSITEILLAQEEVYDDFSSKESKDLIEEVTKKTNQKEESSDFGITRNLYQTVKKDTTSEISSSTVSPIASTMSTTISYNVSSYPVFTPKSSAIYPWIAYNDFTSAEKTAMNNSYCNSYPNAVYSATSTAKYNCHSYAWLSQSTTNGFWINSPNIYWNDGSYQYVGTSPTANGQKVYYDRSGTEHSGVVYNYSTKK